MPTVQDIRDALEREDAALAEKLIGEVKAKRMGKGLSGHDEQEFNRRIARLRALGAKPKPRTGEVAERDASGRFRRRSVPVRFNSTTGDMEIND